jgi:molybdate transport system ATP-binding protein
VGPVDEVFSRPADAEVARAVGTENVFPARRVRRAEGLVTLRAGGAELVAVDPGGDEEEGWACIRAEEVVLEPPDPHASSAQNRLAGEVVARRDDGPLVRITVACGVSLVSVITRASAERLRLVAGVRVHAIVKAPSVRFVPSRSAHPA